MAENRPLTPEKQLLKLIQESKKAKSAPPPKEELSSVGGEAVSLQSETHSMPLMAMASRIFGRLHYFKRTTGDQIASGKLPVDLRAVNFFLLFAIGGGILYLVIDTGYSLAGLGQASNFRLNKSSGDVIEKSQPVTPVKEESYYLDKITARDIFKEGPKLVEKKAVLTGIAKIKSEMETNMSLVGISWSSNPDALIEDKAKKKTYIVRRGQVFGDGVKVQAISKDAVVLSVGENEFELR